MFELWKSMSDFQQEYDVMIKQNLKKKKRKKNFKTEKGNNRKLQRFEKGLLENITHGM